jgi:hypothetical protein
MFIFICDIARGIDEPIWHIISNILLLVIGKEEKWRNKKQKMQNKLLELRKKLYSIEKLSPSSNSNFYAVAMLE